MLSLKWSSYFTFNSSRDHCGRGGGNIVRAIVMVDDYKETVSSGHSRAVTHKNPQWLCLCKLKQDKMPSQKGAVGIKSYPLTGKLLATDSCRERESHSSLNMQLVAG